MRQASVGELWTADELRSEVQERLGCALLDRVRVDWPHFADAVQIHGDVFIADLVDGILRNLPLPSGEKADGQ